jgi:hypothetical protein
MEKEHTPWGPQLLHERRADGGANIVMEHKDIRVGQQSDEVAARRQAAWDAWREKIGREKWRDDLTPERMQEGFDPAEPGGDQTVYTTVHYVDRRASWQDWVMFCVMLLGAAAAGAAILSAI